MRKDMGTAGISVCSPEINHSGKIVERAKVVLVKPRGIGGENAYDWIQRRSVDTVKSAGEVATAMLLTQDTSFHVPF
jgi:AmiR/NasT family two-component response regulator